MRKRTVGTGGNAGRRIDGAVAVGSAVARGGGTGNDGCGEVGIGDTNGILDGGGVGIAEKPKGLPVDVGNTDVDAGDDKGVTDAEVAWNAEALTTGANNESGGVDIAVDGTENDRSRG